MDKIKGLFPFELLSSLLNRKGIERMGNSIIEIGMKHSSKRVLLINPGMDLSFFGRFRWLMKPMPPTGLAYLAAVAEEERWVVRVIDQFTQRWSIKRIIDYAISFKPHVVGITCLTPSAPIANTIGYRIRKILAGTKVVAGNIHADVFFRDILRRGYFDAVVHGEGEEVFRDILRRVSEGEGLDGIKGLSTLKSVEDGINPEPYFVLNRDSLPYPAWHYFPYRRYGLLPFVDIVRPILAISGSSGCPFRCEFCSLVHSGSFYRSRNPLYIADEFEYLHERYGARQIGFIDPIFPLKREIAADFCNKIINRRLNEKIVWSCETRIDMLDKELILILKEAGCRRILLGLESGVERLLRGVKKSINVDETSEKVDFMRRVGIEPIGLFMLGLTGETLKETEKTLSYARELNLNFAKFAMTVPFPGSPMYERLRRNGRFDREDWENWTTFNPYPERIVWSSEGLTPMSLIKLQRKGTFDFYVRPSIIYNHLFRIRSLTLRDLVAGIYGILP